VAIFKDYNPRPVPTEANPVIRQYLDEELQSIAELLNRAAQESIYGGINQPNEIVLQVTVAPQPFVYSGALPFNGVVSDFSSGELVITESGDYELYFFINASADSRILMEYFLYINGAPVGISSKSEIITQKEAENFGAHTIIRFQKGDRISVFVSGAPNNNVTFYNINFSLVKL